MRSLFKPFFAGAQAALLFVITLGAADAPPPVGRTSSLFDGATLAGWEGDLNLWRVQGGVIIGGSTNETVRRNEFLATRRDYTNFIVRFRIKLTGSEGFINSGFQIRSQRVPASSEMSGYQCDFGEPSWYGAIYDESRRNKVLSPSDMKQLGPVIKRNDWNDYVIRADGPRITTWINGVMGTDYSETDTSIPNWDWGKLGIQVHGGGKAQVQVKEITIEELPSTPAAKKFIGAPEPKKSSKESPLTPEEEKAAFVLPPGFEIELVAAESDGIGKFVAIDWDLQGRLWSMTALEYPVDANENPGIAKELYASRAKDKVVVFDQPHGPGPHRPRVFADGLAIPLGILPYQNGVYVQHGPDIVFLRDTDQDGRADSREVILSGFGIQDSHLFPHQFTRGPGDWIWMAQGAFNYGKVSTTRGAEVQFDQTRMARFRYDGSAFEITSQGPCNIWGLVLTGEGEAWIQEANDYGYPMMPFHEYANYPGCSDGQWKSYAPEFPGTAADFRMGGTGLSGLALSDQMSGAQRHDTPASRADHTTPDRAVEGGVTSSPSHYGWPEPYAGIFYIANPILRKIQAIKAERHGPRYRLQKLPDFVQSSDEWFRPVALRTGPDGCLYVVDWYNKIISHNEVPRNHPERDKIRGRIWRIKHKNQKPLPVPDFTKLPADELLTKLGVAALQQNHMAWQAIIDRQMTGLAPKLKETVADASQSPARRIASLWALEGLLRNDPSSARADFFEIPKRMLGDVNRNIRREGIRAWGALPPPVAGAGNLWTHYFDLLDRAASDPEPEVRAEVIKTTALALSLLSLSSDSATASLLHGRAMPLLMRMAKPSLEEPVVKSTHSSRTIKVGEAYEREFERYLVRRFLESQPEITVAFLDSEGAKSIPLESRMVAALALEPKASARRVADLIEDLHRPPNSEELLRLAQFPDEPGVGQALKAVLEKNATRVAVLEALLAVRTRVDPAPLAPLLAEAAGQLLAGNDTMGRELGAKLASAFQLASVESQLVRVLEQTQGIAERSPLPSDSLASLRALRALRSERVEIIETLAKSGQQIVQDEAISALAVSRNPRGPQILIRLYPMFNAIQRRSAIAALASTQPGASAIVKAIRRCELDRDELDAAAFDKLQTVLGDDPDLTALTEGLGSIFRPVLRLNGEDTAWCGTGIALEGPFTVETWVKLDGRIDNSDGILGAPGVLDMNFHDQRFRVWVGGGVHDAAIAKKRISPEVWTHLAVTRDVEGRFRIYQNGELDTDESKRVTDPFNGLRIGWTAPGKGTAGWLAEFRVWNRARTGDEIRFDFDRTLEHADGLVHVLTGTHWGKLQEGAKVAKTADLPPLLTPEEAKVLTGRFAHFRSLAQTAGDASRGQVLFNSICVSCHSVGGQGGQIGPVLNGAGALGVETLLRNILTPNAAMEPGYRVYRVELSDGDVLDGMLISQDKEAIVLRRPNVEDTRISQRDIRKARFAKTSMMPDGLLDALEPQQVSDLFAFLKTLR
jgi:putative membrane-bound dehydrogenase-like protein